MMDMGWGGTDAWYTLDNCAGIMTEGMARYLAPDNVVRFVDDNNVMAGGSGTPKDPYWPLSWAMVVAPSNTTLILKAGSTHLLEGSEATLSKPMTIRGQGVTLRKQ